MHSACAFLNTEGGWMIFGVTPNFHKTIGQGVSLFLCKTLQTIDWSKSIPEIDAQLYAKYGLSEEDIAFIESMIKPM